MFPFVSNRKFWIAIKSAPYWLGLLLLIPLGLGVARLRFDVEVLNLLPGGAPAVQGLKIFQQNSSGYADDNTFHSYTIDVDFDSQTTTWTADGGAASGATVTGSGCCWGCS